MSERGEIARAAAVVSAVTLISRVTGLLRDAVIGYLFGAGAAADAFFVAFRIPNLLRRFVAEGAMGMAFVPVFADYLNRPDRRDAVRAVRVLSTGLAVVLAALTLLGVALAPLWVRAFAPGFAAAPEKLELTIWLTRLLFPYIALVSLGALFGGLLNASRRFLVPAVAPVVLNVSVIAAALALAPRCAPPIAALAYGVLIGGGLQLALQVAPAVRLGYAMQPAWEPAHPAVRRVLALLAPAVFGAAVYQINLLVSTVLASALPAGSVSYLWYADRVFECPLGLFAVALGTAALPSFAAQAVRGAYRELRASLGFALRLTTWVAVPATAGLLVLAEPITATLFGRGAFDTAQVRHTAWALQAFAIGLWPVSVVRLLVPAFYALGDTRTPVVAATAALVANVVFSLALMGPVGTAEATWLAPLASAASAFQFADLRHAGLALATSLAALVNLLVLAAALTRRLGGLDWRPLCGSLARSVAAALVMTPAVQFTAGPIAWTEPGHLSLKAAVLALSIGVGVFIFAAATLLLRAPEVAALRRMIRSRRSS
jgi:putative peptidoglycan lipid II flippase